jgi:hypothetical protein
VECHRRNQLLEVYWLFCELDVVRRVDDLQVGESDKISRGTCERRKPNLIQHSSEMKKVKGLYRTVLRSWSFACAAGMVSRSGQDEISHALAAAVNDQQGTPYTVNKHPSRPSDSKAFWIRHIH